MALNFNTQSAPVASTNNAREKAAGFLNLYLPDAKGGRAKLGAIPLKLSSVEEKRLFEACDKSPEAAEKIMAAILAKLVIEFRSAEKPAGSGFDIY